MDIAPHHWAWQRTRNANHGIATRDNDFDPPKPLIGPDRSPLFCEWCTNYTISPTVSPVFTRLTQCSKRTNDIRQVQKKKKKTGMAREFKALHPSSVIEDLNLAQYGVTEYLNLLSISLNK